MGSRRPRADRSASPSSEPRALGELGPRLPQLARAAIERWLARQERLVVEPFGLGPSAVFVTLRTLRGELRGCLGALTPVEADVARETARLAVLAATRDPRFDPVTPGELAGLRLEVSVLSPEEPARGVEDLDPARYGIVVRDGQGRHAVLLPHLDGVVDARMQVHCALRKAGITPGADVSLSRFEVHEFCEPEREPREGGRSRD